MENGLIPHKCRVVHCKKAKSTIYIGRPSKWGNPFSIGKDGTRAEVIEKYCFWLLKQKHLLASIPELENQILGCWCKPQECHGDILTELVNKDIKAFRTRIMSYLQINRSNI